MRLLLDAHISARRVGRPLQQRSHDVHAIDEERALDGMADEDLLSLAKVEERILVTFNVQDFPRIVRRWAEAQLGHRGCAIVVGIDHSEFGTIIRVIERAFAARPDPADWHDYTAFIARP